MGSGKSEVGAAVARRLGWRLIDTDAEIVAREGRSIAAIFREGGEARFRAIEEDVLRDITRRTQAVIATGGGAVLSSANRRRMKRAGPIVYLKAPVDVLLARLGDDPGRPLLGDDPRASLERIQDERAALYEDGSIVVDAAQRVDAVADAIMARLAGLRHTVRVDLGSRAYDVLIGAGTMALLGYDLAHLGAGGRVAIVTHRTLERRFGARVSGALTGVGFETTVITLPVGERAKSLRAAAALIDAMAAWGLDRTGTILALGGGVIGDIAGFVAGTYMRGVRLVHVPTTLLAQIDSSIGGKAAVNHPRAKNLIGVFHQPALVVADVEVIRSLPAREFRAGLAEVVKYAMTLDRDLLDLLEGRRGATARWTSDDLTNIVSRCAALKARVVEQDEFESGPREVLNYGHTVGHAVEAANPGRHVHGEAIAVGMRVEGQIARRLGLLSEDEVARQDALLAALGLPIVVPPGSIDVLVDAMRLDKKRRDGRIRCTLPEGIGRARLGVEISESLMREVLRECQGSS
ncbi:MAG TPA: 3-dehydroquinate synthase [bacterium]|nr:3-dehydroquinate synthase [bacterium]